MTSLPKLLITLVVVPTLLLAQGLPVKSGAISNLAVVDTNGNLRIAFGPSTAFTYQVNRLKDDLTGTEIHATSTPVYAMRMCWGYPVADTSMGFSSAAETKHMRKATGFSHKFCQECDTTGTVTRTAKMDQRDGNDPNDEVEDATGTTPVFMGSFGATIGEQGVGTADFPSQPTFCISYGASEGKAPQYLNDGSWVPNFGSASNVVVRNLVY